MDWSHRNNQHLWANSGISVDRSRRRPTANGLWWDYQLCECNQLHRRHYRRVVGYANGTEHACRWLSPNDPLQDIHTLSDSPRSIARDVSDDGNIVVGQIVPSNGIFWRAFRWTPQQGMEDLNTLYASLLADGSELHQALAMSPNERFIVGSGLNAATGRREAFILDTGLPAVPTRAMLMRTAMWMTLTCWQYCLLRKRGARLGRVDVNCDAVVDNADLLAVLFAFGQGC